MIKFDKFICFNAFHILLIIMISNIIINSNFEYILNSINYLININTREFWFLIFHVVIAYIILINLHIEIEIKSIIKCNL